MSSEKKKSICRLNLDIGIHVENVDELSRREEDLWMRIYQHFGYRSPLNLIVKIEENTYACKLYKENSEKCKGCPAYQP